MNKDMAVSRKNKAIIYAIKVAKVEPTMEISIKIVKIGSSEKHIKIMRGTNFCKNR